MALREEQWPALPLSEWRDTCETLQLWTQIVGKIRLTLSPWINHSWHAPLYVTAAGLTTSPIPYGTRTFEIEFDFLAHELLIRVSTGERRALPLREETVSEFYRMLMRELETLDIYIHINTHPNEVEHPIPFANDMLHKSYDPLFARRFFQVLAQADRLLQTFRARFIGKNSPVHFFWGSFDLAVTRFSGRPAPSHPGGIPNLPDWVVREAYSHEVSSAGFWPGGGPLPYPLFYSYAYPEPPGFRTGAELPEGAFYSEELHEFVLPYDAVRHSDRPDDTVLAFLQGTYEAAAKLGHWDNTLDFNFRPRHFARSGASRAEHRGL
ncbi:MAG: hypothetical protein K0S16_381 [Moraxellaceae bacterium]|jgi:hypothetical protein|nr:hypothetical protein [Moraxellaceae bacterium]